jgi:hypothetical protein
VDVTDLVAAVMRTVRALARDRLVHFALIGGLLFAFGRGARSDDRISVPSSYLDALHAAQAERMGVAALSADKRDEVDRRAIEDEVLYREALRLGLDRDDAVIRQHLVEKMLLLAEDLGGASREPTAAEVRACFERTRDHWRLDAGVHLLHVFAVRRETLTALADEIQAADREHPDQPPPLGDAFPRARDVRANATDLAATYGDQFADATMRLPVGAWSTPIASRFGWHAVKVLEHTPGRLAALDEVEAQVRLACAVDRRHEAIARFLAGAFARYHVDVDGAPVVDYRPTERVALRAAPSAED